MSVLGLGKNVPGVIVHDPAWQRWTAMGAGASVAVAGGVAGYLGYDRIDDRMMAGGIGVGAAGITTSVAGAVIFRKRFTPYMGGVTYGSVADALAGAAAFKHDVGLHINKDSTRYGLIDLS